MTKQVKKQSLIEERYSRQIAVGGGGNTTIYLKCIAPDCGGQGYQGRATIAQAKEFMQALKQSIADAERLEAAVRAIYKK